MAGIVRFFILDDRLEIAEKRCQRKVQGTEARIMGAAEPPEYPEEKEYRYRDSGADMKC